MPAVPDVAPFQRRFANSIGEGRSAHSDRTTLPSRSATAILDRTGMGPSSTSNVDPQAGERLAALIAVLDVEGEPYVGCHAVPRRHRS